MEKHLEIDLGSGDSMSATLDTTQDLCIHINSDWAGDSETGFGQSLNAYLNKEQAKKLRDFLNQLQL